MKANILGVREQPVSVDVVLFGMRVIVGYAFMLHGWGKIQNPMSWMGAESPVPGIFQALAALSEFGGGLALILGLLTRLGSLGIAFTMSVAVLMHRFAWGDPFVNLKGGSSYELATVYLLIALLFVIGGAGRYSLDRKIFGVTS